MSDNHVYWEGAMDLPDDLPPTQRFSELIRYHLKRDVRVGNAESLGAAVATFSELTGLSTIRIDEIVGGAMPTSVELDEIRLRLRWSECFMFGISEAAMEKTLNRYFFALGIDKPSVAQRHAFEATYNKALRRVRQIICDRITGNEESND